jgi:hypothetical protein
MNVESHFPCRHNFVDVYREQWARAGCPIDVKDDFWVECDKHNRSHSICKYCGEVKNGSANEDMQGLLYKENGLAIF